MNQSAVLCLGNGSVDILTYLPSFPINGEKTIIKNLTRVIGGSATNVAANLSKLSVKTSLMARIGEDPNSNEFIRLIKERGIYVNLLQIDKDLEMGTTIILIAEKGESTKLGYRGANKKLSVPEEIDLSSFSYIHCASIDSKIANEIVEKAKKRNITCSLDIGSTMIREQPDVLIDICQKFDLVFLNRFAFKRIFGINNGEELSLDQIKAHLSSEKNPLFNNKLIITLGEEGLIWSKQGTIFCEPAVSLEEVVDTTGAGDAVAAVIIWSELNQVDAQNSLKMANLAASKTIMKAGGINGFPTSLKLN
ncbi:MAG: carbohydrate kinase family protein [Candidatus Heimdallarchaeota archaeon]|nr:carbohydrate kinase family protein [Candidatus Heimdallarchaeota archaeon]MCK5048233.1 carbohydrate kinase family protein [Candidatus Heimdallarchaeota archaeon]